MHRRIALSDPGIDDYRNELLWSPESPDADRRAARAVGRRAASVLDAVEQLHGAARRSPCRAIAFVLNGRPYPLRLVLDQGYWPETGLTAPDDDALRRDVELAKAMGFNGVRKHQKIEDPRYLYWADRLGLLVWEEMPSAYRFTQPIDRARDARVDGGDRPRLQPPVHHRVGAVQRVVGRAEPARQRRASGTTCRRSTT